MSEPTRDEIKQAAEHCVKGDCTGCPFEQEKGNPCDTWFARALLSAYEREEKMLAVVQEAIDGRPPREWIQRMADLYAEAKLAAIKAAEEPTP